MNSEPMSPSGTSAIAPTTSTKHTIGTRMRFRNTHGSALAT